MISQYRVYTVESGNSAHPVTLRSTRCMSLPAVKLSRTCFIVEFTVKFIGSGWKSSLVSIFDKYQVSSYNKQSQIQSIQHASPLFTSDLIEYSWAIDLDSQVISPDSAINYIIWIDKKFPYTGLFSDKRLYCADLPDMYTVAEWVG